MQIIMNPSLDSDSEALIERRGLKDLQPSALLEGSGCISTRQNSHALRQLFDMNPAGPVS